MHGPLPYIDLPQLVVPESTKSGLGEQALEALDDPLPLEAGVVDDGLPHVLTDHQHPEGLFESQVLHYF